MKIHRIAYLVLLIALLAAGSGCRSASAAGDIRQTSPQRISFAAGATSAQVSGNLAANGSMRYVLRILAGQLLDVGLSPVESVSLTIYGVNGTVLQTGGGFFRGTVPYTQDYIIQVSAGVQPVAYWMDIIIPERITFPSGGTWAVMQDTVAAYTSHHYLVGVMAGQLMDIGTTSDQEVQVTVYGVDGTVLQSGMATRPSFRGTVPTTQDYIIHVSAGEKPAVYSMQVVIPERVSFAAGAISSQLQGTLAASDTHYYVLRAMAGQTMEVSASPAGYVRLIIYGVDGSVLASGMGDAAYFRGALPVTQDYIIAINAGPQPVTYWAQIVIR